MHPPQYPLRAIAQCSEVQFLLAVCQLVEF
jgi:hypothetical protein